MSLKKRKETKYVLCQCKFHSSFIANKSEKIELFLILQFINKKPLPDKNDVNPKIRTLYIRLAAN